MPPRQRQAVLGAQASRREGTDYDLEAFFGDRTDGKLIYMTDAEVSVSQTDREVTVCASAAKSIMELSVCQKARIAEPEKKPEDNSRGGISEDYI